MCTYVAGGSSHTPGGQSYCMAGSSAVLEEREVPICVYRPIVYVIII